MLNLRCIHSSDSESDGEIEIDPEILKEIKNQQQNDNEKYLFELNVKSLESSEPEENSEYMCEINTITTAETDSDESEGPVITLKDELLARLFISDSRIDMSWISKIRDGFEQMDPEEQHDVSYSLVTRLLSALEYFINTNNTTKQQTFNSHRELNTNKNERHVSFEEGLRLLQDSDDENPIQIDDQIQKSSESDSDDENIENNNDDYELITTPPTMVEQKPTPKHFNNSKRRFEYNIPIDIDDEEEEEQKKAIRRLSRRARKWKRLARDRLQEIQRDIEFRDRLIEALLKNQRDDDDSIKPQNISTKTI